MASLLRGAEAPKATMQIALAIINNARLALGIIYTIDYCDKSISLGLAKHRQ
jgi:hypothetical protein